MKPTTRTSKGIFCIWIYSFVRLHILNSFHEIKIAITLDKQSIATDVSKNDQGSHDHID